MSKNDIKPNQENVPNRILELQNRPITFSSIWGVLKKILFVIILIVAIIEISNNFKEKDNKITNLGYCALVKDKIISSQNDLMGKIQEGSYKSTLKQQDVFALEEKLIELVKEADLNCPSREERCLLLQTTILETSQEVDRINKDKADGKELHASEKYRRAWLQDLKIQFRQECGGKS